MNVRTFTLTASALVIGLVGSIVAIRAQGPLYDKVIVDLPYSISVRGTTLQPGHYVIRQLESTDNSRVLQIFSNDGMKLETSVMTIPTLDNNTPDKTTVVLHHFGNDYYFDKVWIQGKNYGYEFPLPDEVKARERERMAPVNVAANYQSAPADTSTTAQSTTTQESTTTTEQAQTQPVAPPQPEPQPSVSAETHERHEDQVAQNQSSTSDLDRDRGSADRSMPSTAANWLTMLLGGGLLSGAGMTIRRWTR